MYNLCINFKLFVAKITRIAVDFVLLILTYPIQAIFYGHVQKAIFEIPAG